MAHHPSPAFTFAGIAPDAIRRQNLSAILRRIHVHGPASRSALATLTGLNRSTVGALVGELVESGLAVESTPTATGLPGRPSPIVAVRPTGAVVLVIEVSVDSLAVALVGLGGSLLATRRVARSRDSRTVEAILATLRAEALNLLESRGSPSIVAVGVAIAGVVRRGDGFLVAAPNLDWYDVALADRVDETFNLHVPIVVGNDADLVTIAEFIRGAGRGTSDFVCLWGEVGVGAGIVSEGRTLRGRSGLAGEVGHLAIRPGGRLCHCGARGCWETEVGEEALLRAVRGSSELPGPAGVDALVADAERGDPETLEALTRLGRWLGLGLAGLVNVLDPERIALGGLFGRLHPFVAAAIDQELRRRRMATARPRVEVVPAELGPNAPLIGAAELALAPLLDDPASARLGRAGPSTGNEVRSKEVTSAVTA